MQTISAELSASGQRIPTKGRIELGFLNDGKFSMTLECVTTTILPPQPFYGLFSGTAQVRWCQQRTSGLYGARGD